MQLLQIFICENLYPEYQAVLKQERFEDVMLQVLPSICEHKARKADAQSKLEASPDTHSLVLCSNTCELGKLPTSDSKKKITGNYCFSSLISDDFLNYLTAQGSYIISAGWLKNWEKRLAVMGFDKQMARKFFAESCRQLVFLDAGLLDHAKWLLKDLSSYVGLPYITIPTELETLRLLLRNVVYEWRLHNQKANSAAAINELRNQCAEYSAVFDMLGKISTYTSRRDVIGKIKELFLMVFGAQQFTFHGDASGIKENNVHDNQSDNEDSFLLLKEENRFLIRIEWDGILYGVMDVGGFMFPQYIEKYLNLAIEISKFCGLVLHNNEQYERVLASEKELKYISFHDSMTGLYNRTFINQKLKDKAADRNAIVFMFDIDKLKVVNDQHGHAEGDKLISSFARVAGICFRETDLVARVGGDEFTAFLYDADQETAEQIKQRMIEQIKMNNTCLEAQHLKLSVSIGYAQVESPGDSLEDLMKRADERMYEDKMRRRGQKENKQARQTFG